jgi:hypothetical protein
MSNISANNYSVSGTASFSGTVSLAQPLISGSTCNYQGMTTTDLSTTGLVTFNNTMPSCNVLPVASGELTNKSYVDTINNSQNVRMTAIEGVNSTQTTNIAGLTTRLTTNEALDVTQNSRLLAIEGINSTQTTNIAGLTTRLTTNEALDVVQDGRILPLETKTTNLSFATNRTTLSGVSTVGGIMTHTVPPVSAVLPTGLTQVANKQYVDNNIQIVNNSILTTNNNVTALTTRVGTTENKLTNVTFAGGSGTTSISGACAFLNAPTVAGTGTLASSVMNKSYIDSQDLVSSVAISGLQTRATTIEGVNTSQATSITALQQKTAPIVNVTPVPVTGALTEITGSVSLLPFTNASIFKAFSLSCNNIICTTQAVFGGVGVNRGITASVVQVSGFGTPYQQFMFGTVLSTVGTNIVTFTTALNTGTPFPKIFLTPLGSNSSVITLTNRSLTGFVFSATTVVNVDWMCIQGL